MPTIYRMPVEFICYALFSFLLLFLIYFPLFFLFNMNNFSRWTAPVVVGGSARSCGGTTECMALVIRGKEEALVETGDGPSISADKLLISIWSSAHRAKSHSIPKLV